MSASPVDDVRQHSLGLLPARTARRFADKLAIIDGDTRLSFAQFEDVVGRTAAALSADGLGTGDRLALLSRNCWQFAALSFATARLGAVLVPINFMLGPSEIAYLLEHSGAHVFVVEQPLLPVATTALELATAAVQTKAVIVRDQPSPPGWADAAAWFEYSGDQVTAPTVADDDPIRLMYTSGTESRPKGVLLSSRSLLWQYVSCIVDGQMSADDVELHSLPLYHCAQLDCFLGPDLYLGATSIIVPAPDPAVLLHTIETERVTKFFAPPTVWIALLRAPQFDSTDLSSLRKGYYGASAMPVEILREIQQRLPEVRLWNFYGQTEMAPLATILGPDEQLTHAGSAGRAALNVETAIVDERDRPVAAGVVGEIVHRSPHATLGYYRDEEKTAEAFRNGWFHSGDLGVLDEQGRLTVVDRMKDMIKTGGENVASREVEEAIYQLTDVAEVAVFGVSHPRWVEAVTAAVVPKPGADLTAAAVIDHTRGILAAFKVPKYVAVVDALPKNPSGKILKRQLRDDHADVFRTDSD